MYFIEAVEKIELLLVRNSLLETMREKEVSSMNG